MIGLAAPCGTEPGTAQYGNGEGVAQDTKEAVARYRKVNGQCCQQRKLKKHNMVFSANQGLYFAK